MSDFEKWFKDQDFYTNMRFIHGDKLFDKDGDVYRVLLVQMSYQAWGSQRQRSKDEFVALTQEWHTKGWNARQGEIDELKAQLNNMEACYIEKKKRVELLESNIKNLVVQLSNNYEVAEGEYKKNADSYYSGKCDAFDLAEQLACLALRGDSDQHLTR
ncbi:hypothetical protein [Acinetobacter sp. YH12086]|uniref:hypothetical protein n=1 Tax=Acinetobacter sp. YH12086 TaxID=2601078 RepID=UPI0015D14DD8|nr:hypothetical protein [Acinetobacter sp. YH12086]